MGRDDLTYGMTSHCAKKADAEGFWDLSAATVA